MDEATTEFCRALPGELFVRKNYCCWIKYYKIEVINTGLFSKLIYTLKNKHQNKFGEE